MFTLQRATKIFPDTRTADVVPAVTARFQLLSAEDQLALIWYLPEGPYSAMPLPRDSNWKTIISAPYPNAYTLS